MALWKVAKSHGRSYNGRRFMRSSPQYALKIWSAP